MFSPVKHVLSMFLVEVTLLCYRLLKICYQSILSSSHISPSSTWILNKICKKWPFLRSNLVSSYVMAAGHHIIDLNRFNMYGSVKPKKGSSYKHRRI